MVHIICVLFLYLFTYLTCVKVMIAMFYFCHWESPSNIMKSVFNSISICSWKKSILLNKTKSKCVIRKMAKFFLQKFVIFSMITDCFLVKKWGTLQVARRLKTYVVKKVFLLVFLKLLKNKIHLGRVFPSPFMQNISKRQMFVLKTFKFLIFYLTIS